MATLVNSTPASRSTTGLSATQYARLSCDRITAQKLADVLLEQFEDASVAAFEDADGNWHAELYVDGALDEAMVRKIVRDAAGDAQAHDLWTNATEITRLAEAARSGKAVRDELAGSTLTITSLGRLGGIMSTPVINHPEVAIIGVNRIAQRPVILDGAIVARQVMNLSSSFDHRVVDGAVAAAFVQRLRACLEHPATLFVE